MRLISNQAFKLERPEGATVSGVRLEDCSFDNCVARDCRFERIELIRCSTWSCHLRDLVVEDCLIDGVKTTVTPGGGKRMPLFLWGVRVKHVVVQGRVGGVIWNPPYHWWTRPWPEPEIDEYRAYYANLDWALDISKAEFSSVPSFRFGPPGQLIRRDPKTQPLVTRERARGALLPDEVGVWGVVIDDFLKNPWPDAIVLTPAKGSRKYHEDLAGIELLRAIGVAE